MKNLFVYILLFSLPTIGVAQQLPVNDCGIVYVYDEAGNRTKRVYFCNNGMDPYPLKQVPIVAQPANEAIKSDLTFNKVEDRSLFNKLEGTHFKIQEIEALYPNPTSGIFYIFFYKALNNATISIVDINGKVMQHFQSTGIKVTCDLSLLPSGSYFVRVQEKGRILSKKVIKL